CLWTALRGEVLRTDLVSAETKTGLTVLAGLVVAPFVTILWGAATVWWLATGKRLPGWAGRIVGPPASWFLHADPKQLKQLPPEMRHALENLRTSAMPDL